MLSRIFNDDSGNLLGKVTGVGLVLIALNVLAWVWAFVAFHDYPLLMGTALLAYSFGLRHAVDADHIAAIDNVTRKLMQEGKRPVSVGLFFSLGHSTIVVLLSLLRGGDHLGPAGPLRGHEGHRRRGRHQRLGLLPVRHRRRQPRHPGRSPGRASQSVKSGGA